MPVRAPVCAARSALPPADPTKKKGHKGRASPDGDVASPGSHSRERAAVAIDEVHGELGAGVLWRDLVHTRAYG